MALIDAHLREITLCTSTISELHFLPPKIFTNAILRTNDITALIRDTEAHERALFSLAPIPEPFTNTFSEGARNTNLERAVAGRLGNSYRLRARNTAVAAVLGGDLAEILRRERNGGGRTKQTTAPPGQDIDVELLLKGAEKLCAVYPIQGAPEKIAALRNRYRKIQASVNHYESLVAEQSSQLRHLKRPSHRMSEYDDDDAASQPAATEPLMTEDDLRREEEEVRELEQKKRALEERVNGMDKDLGGLAR